VPGISGGDVERVKAQARRRRAAARAAILPSSERYAAWWRPPRTPPQATTRHRRHRPQARWAAANAVILLRRHRPVTRAVLHMPAQWVRPPRHTCAGLSDPLAVQVYREQPVKKQLCHRLPSGRSTSGSCTCSRRRARARSARWIGTRLNALDSDGRHCSSILNQLAYGTALNVKHRMNHDGRTADLRNVIQSSDVIR
jgi:hypothetical protein